MCFLCRILYQRYLRHGAEQKQPLVRCSYGRSCVLHSVFLLVVRRRQQMEQQIEKNVQERIQTARPGDDDCLDTTVSDMVSKTVFSCYSHCYLLNI